MPDYTLMTELQEFQAEPSGLAPEALTVKVKVMMTLIRETDRSIVASRRLTSTEAVASGENLLLLGCFDRAVQSVLQEAVAWTRAQAG